ncbi:MAG TPA: amino acid permease [Candidatus Nanoarchaeia archaeon]|nr:amino acid permease [Candidatus Nanoarchaeia archaeon]
MAELERILSFKVLLLITINSIIGSGMFFLPGLGAKVAGPASIIAWVILCISAIYTAYCFGELVSMFPTTGGIYEFSKQAYGRFPSFMIGWLSWVVGNVTTAMLIVGAIQYILPYNTPFFITAKIAICLAWVLIFNAMAYSGMKTSSFMLVTFAFITIGAVVGLSLPALLHMDLQNLTPIFIHEGALKNITILFTTVFLISETFFGLESVTFLAGETKDPERVLPKVLVTATIIISVMALLLVLTSLASVHWKVFGGTDALTDPTEIRFFGEHVTAPYAYLAYIMFGKTGMDIMVIVTYLVIMGAAAGWVVTSPRLILSLAEDKLFPPQFSKIHPKLGTPYKAIIFQAIVAAVFVVIGFQGKGYETLLSILIPLVLIMMSAVILTVPILRRTKPDIARPFKMPWANAGSIILVLFNLFLLTVWIFEKGGEAWHLLSIGATLIITGVPFYFLIEMYYDPKAIAEVNDMFAYVAVMTERIMLPRKVRETIFQMLGDLRGKRVLEYGCNVGTLTQHLAEAVKPGGRVYALSHLKYSSVIARKRMTKKGHTHVDIMHDPVPNRILPETPQSDAAVSLGQLGYVQQTEEVLTQINRRLKVYDKICFVDYDKFFDIIPNIDWLSDDGKIQEIFRKAGFDVEVMRKQGFAWQYIYIFGEKARDV